MHGLIFKTSIYDWQDQPDSYGRSVCAVGCAVACLWPPASCSEERVLVRVYRHILRWLLALSARQLRELSQPELRRLLSSGVLQRCAAAVEKLFQASSRGVRAVCAPLDQLLFCTPSPHICFCRRLAPLLQGCKVPGDASFSVCMNMDMFYFVVKREKICFVSGFLIGDHCNAAMPNHSLFG